MDKQEKPILSLLQNIQSGAIDPRDIKQDLRQQIVEVLLLEGTMVPQIAQILKVSDKTIRRDIADIKERNALTPSLELAKQIIGDMKMKAEAHRSHLMRLARTQDATVSEKSLAEFYAWKVSKELVEKLQSVGYLPMVPYKIDAEVYHHDEEGAQTLGELKDELTGLEKIVKQGQISDKNIEKRIEFLRMKIEKAEIVDDVEKMSQKKKEDENENINE